MKKFRLSTLLLAASMLKGAVAFGSGFDEALNPAAIAEAQKSDLLQREFSNLYTALGDISKGRVLFTTPDNRMQVTSEFEFSSDRLLDRSSDFETLTVSEEAVEILQRIFPEAGSFGFLTLQEGDFEKPYVNYNFSSKLIPSTLSEMRSVLDPLFVGLSDVSEESKNEFAIRLSTLDGFPSLREFLRTGIRSQLLFHDSSAEIEKIETEINYRLSPGDRMHETLVPILIFSDPATFSTLEEVTKHLDDLSFIVSALMSSFRYDARFDVQGLRISDPSQAISHSLNFDKGFCTDIGGSKMSFEQKKELIQGLIDEGFRPSDLIFPADMTLDIPALESHETVADRIAYIRGLIQ